MREMKRDENLTDELVVLALLDVNTDGPAADDVVGENIVLRAPVVSRDVCLVASHVGVETVYKYGDATERFSRMS